MNLFRDLFTKKEKKKMLIGICVAVILVVQYISGLLTQMKVNGPGGVSGNPFECWKYAFTKSGIGTTLFMVGFVVVTIILLKLYHVFDAKDRDERGFIFSKEGTYGTARWMSDREKKTIYNVTSVTGTKGMILGADSAVPWDGPYHGKVVSLKKDSRLNPHMAIFGASGTGKTRSVVRPAVFQAINRGESCVLTDPKGELYNDTSQLFRENGYEVKVFNLVSPMNSDGWNCMSDLQGDSLLAAVLANVIIGNTSSGRGDHFWDNGEMNLLKALILYVDQNPMYKPEEKNLGTVYTMVTNKTPDELKVLFDVLPDDHPAKAPYNLFAQSDAKVQQGIVLGLGTRLGVIQDKLVKQLISNADIELTAPGDHKCAYYVILSAQDSTMQFLSSLFFSLFFIKLTRFGDKQPKGRLPVPVNVILDEFCNIGRIGGAADGSDFAKVVSVVRSYGIKIMMIIQSLGQLQNRYPNNLWAELIGNCDTQISLGCTDDVTAKYISDRSGTVSIDVVSEAKQKKTIAIAQFIPQYRESVGAGKRALLTQDEVLRFPNEELLVFTRGQNALRLYKLDYTKYPMSKRMKDVNIYDYHRNDVIDVKLDPVPEIIEEETLDPGPEDAKEFITEMIEKIKKKINKEDPGSDKKPEKPKEEEYNTHTSAEIFGSIERDSQRQAEEFARSESSKSGSSESSGSSSHSLHRSSDSESSASDKKNFGMMFNPGDTFTKDGVTYVITSTGECVAITSSPAKQASPVSSSYDHVSEAASASDSDTGSDREADPYSEADSLSAADFMSDGDTFDPSASDTFDPSGFDSYEPPAEHQTYGDDFLNDADAITKENERLMDDLDKRISSFGSFSSEPKESNLAKQADGPAFLSDPAGEAGDIGTWMNDSSGAEDEQKKAEEEKREREKKEAERRAKAIQKEEKKTVKVEKIKINF